MAEAFLRSFDPALEVFSAGTRPAERVHPLAVKVMKELNIDISANRPKSVDAFIRNSFDYVITVCDNAKETCPIFLGKVQHRVHIGFDDPAEAKGSPEQVLIEFRQVRDEIRNGFHEFYKSELL